MFLLSEEIRQLGEDHLPSETFHRALPVTLPVHGKKLQVLLVNEKKTNIYLNHETIALIK